MQEVDTPSGHICQDHFWNANLTWYSAVPDFTQCFQQIIFVLVPSSVFCILGFISLWINSKRPAETGFSWTVLRILKMALCVILIMISISDISLLIYRKSLDGTSLDITFYASCIKTISYIIAIVMLKQGRRRRIRSSALLSIYWFIFSICNAFVYRSSIIRALAEVTLSFPIDEYILNAIHFPIIISLFVLSLFNDPENLLSARISFMEDSPIFSIMTFYWFNSYIYKSSKKLLTVKDFQPLNFQLEASYLWEKFKIQWAKALKKREHHEEQKESTEEPKKSSWMLIWVLVKSVWPYFLYACIMQLMYDFLLFLPAILLDKLITFISEDEYAWRGFLYCFALFFSDLITQAIYCFIFFFSALFGNQVKSITISAIYRKAITLSSTARQQYTSGEMVNLMSVDVQNLFEFCYFSTFTFGTPLKLLLTVLMLWRYLGPSCLAGATVLVIVMILGLFIAQKTKLVQEKQMKMKDLRLKHMNELLNGIKVLKLYAWEIPFMDKISNIRQKEINLLRIFQLLFAVTVFIWSCGPFFIAIACLVTYVLIDETHVLTATIIFVSINLLNILRHSAFEIPELIARLVQMKVSLERIVKFLMSDEYKEDVIGNQCEPGEVLSVRDGVFAWSADSEPTLTNIDLHVPNGSLIAITGPVGSGKSSLLSAILGEMDKRSGSVNINGTVSYVPQQAWILNRTLRENILFVSPTSKTKYDTVLDVCCLRPDLEVLPGGDKTEIGEKGVNLSGGQKQRVSLARSIYHNADIYLFDDPLSAVDAHVGKHIFEHVISKDGILRDKTRVLVTHSINVLPETDFIITMKEGKIEETGTYAQLMENKGVFADFIAEHSKNREEDKDDEKRVLEAGDDSVSETDTSINHYASLQRNLSVESAISAKLVDDESMEVGKVKRAIFLNYAKHVGFWLLFGILSGTLASDAFEIGMNGWLSKWSEDSTNKGVQDVSKRNLRIAIYAVLGLCKTFAKIASSICLAFGSAKAAKLYHKEMLQSVMQAPMSFFDTTPLGRIVNRFGRDINDVDTGIGPNMESFFGCIFHLIGAVAVIGTNTPLILAFLIPVGVTFYLIQKFYLIISRQLQRLSSTSRSPIYSHFTETVDGTSSIRAYKATDVFVESADDKLNTHIICQLYLSMSYRWLKFYISFVGEIMILLAAVLAVNSRDDMEAGQVGLSLVYALSITEVLAWMIYSGSELENKCISIERVEEYSNLPSEAPWVVPSPSLPSLWPIKGSLEFKNYSTRYREGLDLVIKNINLHIKENEKVGIVGRTGAGKSSFALALFRIIEPVTGTVLIDDVDVLKIGLHQLRSKLTIIPQDPVLFTGQLRVNLDPDSNHSDAELWASLESAHLKTFVSSLDEGLNHEIAEGGDNLSVGQRQLVCLARALLKQAKILILDEATAAVDMETDRLIQNTIRTEFKDYTVITIAHRLNTIMDYDKVVVMDSGEITEVGSPSELLEKPDSYFSSMAKDAGLL